MVHPLLDALRAPTSQPKLASAPPFEIHFAWDTKQCGEPFRAIYNNVLRHGSASSPVDNDAATLRPDVARVIAVADP